MIHILCYWNCSAVRECVTLSLIQTVAPSYYYNCYAIMLWYSCIFVFSGLAVGVVSSFGCEIRVSINRALAAQCKPHVSHRVRTTCKIQIFEEVETQLPVCRYLMSDVIIDVITNNNTSAIKYCRYQYQYLNCDNTFHRLFHSAAFIFSRSSINTVNRKIVVKK